MISLVLIVALIYITVVFGESIPLVYANGTRIYDPGNGGYKLSIFRIDDEVWVYYGSWHQPACISHFWDSGNSVSITVGDAMLRSGDKFSGKICIKSGCIAMYAAPNSQYTLSNIDTDKCCPFKGNRLNSRVCNIDASCNSEGCITKYGYVRKDCIE